MLDTAIAFPCVVVIESLTELRIEKNCSWDECSQVFFVHLRKCFLVGREDDCLSPYYVIDLIWSVDPCCILQREQY